MPGFSAENSLYRTSRHYKIDRHAINIITAVMSPLKPAAIDLDNVGEEVIPIEGIAPPWGWGSSGWVVVGDTGGASTSQPSPSGEGGIEIGGKTIIKRTFRPKEGGECHGEQGTPGKLGHVRIQRGEYTKISGKWNCCLENDKDFCVTSCPNKPNAGGSNKHYCFDGQAIDYGSDST